MSFQTINEITQKTDIYSDGADLESMLELARDPNIAGITTNPSLMKKAGVTDYRAYAKEVLTQIQDKPISFEVFADDIDEMRRQALEIKSWGENVFVKIPITNSTGVSCIPLIQELSQAGVNLNVTALFTLEQVQATCDAVKGGAQTIVSVFAGRVADTGRDPMPLMKECLKICQATGPNARLLWASCREVYNIIQAAEMNCPIITAPPSIIGKLKLLNRGLEEMSLDTVQAFKKDSEAAGFSL